MYINLSEIMVLRIVNLALRHHDSEYVATEVDGADILLKNEQKDTAIMFNTKTQTTHFFDDAGDKFIPSNELEWDDIETIQLLLTKTMGG